MPTQAKSFFAQLQQFEFPAKKKIVISATPRVMAGPHLPRLISCLVHPEGVRNDPHQDLHAQAVAQEKT